MYPPRRCLQSEQTRSPRTCQCLSQPLSLFPAPAICSIGHVKHPKPALHLSPTTWKAPQPHTKRSRNWIVAAALAIIAFFWLRPKITISSYVDELGKDAVITADAMESSNDAATRMINARLYACKMIEVAEALYEDPRQHTDQQSLVARAAL